jgi:outer membrane protein assembly factor BamD
MNNYFNKYIYLALFAVLLSSCSKYEKLLKSNDYEKKFQAAIKYYEDRNYAKAYPLLEEMVGLYRGTEKAEKVYYYYSYCNYYMGDYVFAAYHFKNFYKTYPSSKYAEECLYMNAYCYYLESPEPTLDQTNTMMAINELQLFTDKFPESTKRVADANELIDKLRYKIEYKAYLNAKLYFKTMNYKATIVSVENMIKDFPGSKFTEELLFLSLKSAYLYAINSIEKKQEERLKFTLESYYNFIDKFPNSAYVKEAQSIYDGTIKHSKALNFNINL